MSRDTAGGHGAPVSQWIKDAQKLEPYRVRQASATMAAIVEAFSGLRAAVSRASLALSSLPAGQDFVPPVEDGLSPEPLIGPVPGQDSGDDSTEDTQDSGDTPWHMTSWGQRGQFFDGTHWRTRRPRPYVPQGHP